MSDTKLSAAERLFLQASDLPSEQRTAFLDEACGNDDALREEIAAMLDAAEPGAAFFGALSDRLGVDRLRDGEPEPDRTGQQFGSYRLTSLLGTGGMGSVWHAERADGRFEGAVAVKLLTRSRSHSALARFDREAHYLAKLTHPNIARLIDAGVGPDKTPFLVLDYVEGVPIDVYCDHRRLGVDERLRLCIGVIDAVSHAHARLVVHNDIKPSNVLIADDGSVKLLDFGIATLLSETDNERQGMALTPEFASPEQLRGERITTATDVYSLGLLLYLLLTGSSPRRVDDATNLDELREELNRAPPPLASTLRNTESVNATTLEQLAEVRDASPRRLLKLLQGELDDIVRKALAVDAADRYENAADLASDLRRYRRGEPVSAIPDTLGYRSRKFVGRHRGSVLSAVLTAILLIAAAGITTWQSIEARQQRDAAVYQQQRVHASNELYSLLLEDLGSGGQAFTAVELLDRGAVLLERQFDANDPFVGRLYYDLSRRYAGLREQNRELELLAAAESSARLSDDPDLLAVALCATARTIAFKDTQGAREMLSEGSAALGRAAEPSLDTVVACTRAEAALAEIDGDQDTAVELLQAAVQRFESAAVTSTHLRGVTMNDLANLHFKSGRYEEALSMVESILSMQQRTGRGSTFTYLQVSANRATLLGTLGEIRAEEEARRRLIETIEQSNWADDRGLLQHRAAYSSTLIRLSRYEEGIALARDTLDVARSLGNDIIAAMMHLTLARGYAATGRPDEAEANVDIAEAALAENAGRWRFQLARVELLRARIARERGDFVAAKAIVDAVLREQGYPSLDNGSPMLRAALVSAARAALDVEDWVAAERYATEFVPLEEAIARGPDTSANVGSVLVRRAKARIGLGDAAGARADLTRAVRVLAQSLGDDNRETVEARELLAGLER